MYLQTAMAQCEAPFGQCPKERSFFMASLSCEVQSQSCSLLSQRQSCPTQKWGASVLRGSPYGENCVRDAKSYLNGLWEVGASTSDTSYTASTWGGLARENWTLWLTAAQCAMGLGIMGDLELWVTLNHYWPKAKRILAKGQKCQWAIPCQRSEKKRSTSKSGFFFNEMWKILRQNDNFDRFFNHFCNFWVF